jgi:hypothetical protein
MLITLCTSTHKTIILIHPCIHSNKQTNAGEVLLQFRFSDIRNIVVFFHYFSFRTEVRPVQLGESAKVRRPLIPNLIVHLINTKSVPRFSQVRLCILLMYSAPRLPIRFLSEVRTGLYRG